MQKNKITKITTMIIIMYSNLNLIHELSESGESGLVLGLLGILRFHPEGPGCGEFSLFAEDIGILGFNPEGPGCGDTSLVPLFFLRRLGG